MSQNTAALCSSTPALSQDISVGIVTVIQTGGSRNRDSIFCGGKKCLFVQSVKTLETDDRRSLPLSVYLPCVCKDR